MKHSKFWSIVDAVSGMSKDRSTKVGAIALDDHFNILATGYNGFPRGINDNAEERHERPAKYLWTSHAEENLVAQSAYNGRSLRGSTVLVSALFPCATCARLLIQAGVRTVIIRGKPNPRWEEQNAVAREMFNEAGVLVMEEQDGR